MQKLLFIIITLLSNTFIIAQNDSTASLLKDENITWVAEVEQVVKLEDYELDDCKINSYIDHQKYNSESYLIKYDYSNVNCNFWSEKKTFLFDNIIKKIRNNKLIAHNDKGEELSYDDLIDIYSQVDTFVSVDPLTFDEVIDVAHNVGLYQIYKFKCYWYYDKRDKKIHTILSSVHPILNPKYENDEMISYDTYEIPFPQSKTSELNINSEAVVWSKYIKSNIDLENAIVLKGNTEDMLQEVFYHNVNDDKYTIVDNSNYCTIKEKDFVLQFYNSRTETFVGHTDQLTKIEYDIKTEAVSPLDFKQLKYNQYWFWNKETEQLECKLESISPIMAITSFQVLAPDIKGTTYGNHFYLKMN